MIKCIQFRKQSLCIFHILRDENVIGKCQLMRSRTQDQTVARCLFRQNVCMHFVVDGGHARRASRIVGFAFLHDGCGGNSEPIFLSQNDTRIIISHIHLRCGWTQQTILSILFYFSNEEIVCQSLFLHPGPLAETGAFAAVLKPSTQ